MAYRVYSHDLSIHTFVGQASLSILIRCTIDVFDLSRNIKSNTENANFLPDEISSQWVQCTRFMKQTPRVG